MLSYLMLQNRNLLVSRKIRLRKFRFPFDDVVFDLLILLFAFLFRMHKSCFETFPSCALYNGAAASGDPNGDLLAVGLGGGTPSK